MSARGVYGKILVVDTNLFFVKRLTEALREQGFEVIHSTEPAYALTMIEWNMPVAILCGVNLRNSNSFEIPSILRADVKTRHIPVIGIGDRGQQSQLQALRAGHDDFLDRRLSAEEIAAHLLSILTSHQEGFRPTQMLCRSETALDGRLSLVDLPGMIQVLAQSRQTGALHVNAPATDGVIFFDAGEVIHAESGQYAGDEAIAHLIKSCCGLTDGVYKFIPGDAVTLRTVQGNLNALILDALRQLDERDSDLTARNDACPAPEVIEQDARLESEGPSAPDEPAANSADLSSRAEIREREDGPEPGNQPPPLPAAPSGDSEPVGFSELADDSAASDLPGKFAGWEFGAPLETEPKPETIAGSPAGASEEVPQPPEAKPEVVKGAEIFSLPKELDLNSGIENNPIRALFKDFIEEAVGNEETHE